MLKRSWPSPPPSLSAYAVGFPCQPFSSQGKKLGFADPRAKTVACVFETLMKTLPLYALLENVVGLKKCMSKFVGLLKKYEVLTHYYVFVMPSCPSKVFCGPIRRSRLYFVLARQDVAASSDIQQLRRLVESVVGAVHSKAVPLSVSDVLGRPSESSPTHGPMSRPLTIREDTIIKELVKKYADKGNKHRLVVDISQSAARVPHGVLVSPCLTTSSGLVTVDMASGNVSGISAQGKLLLHGVDLCKYKVTSMITETALHKLAGNGMHLGCVELGILLGNLLVDWKKAGNKAWIEMKRPGTLKAPVTWSSPAALLKASKVKTNAKMTMKTIPGKKKKKIAVERKASKPSPSPSKAKFKGGGKQGARKRPASAMHTKATKDKACSSEQPLKQNRLGAMLRRR